MPDCFASLILKQCVSLLKVFPERLDALAPIYLLQIYQ